MEEFDGIGIQFPGKFVGRVPVEDRSGSASSQQAMRLAKSNVKSGLYNSAKKKVKVLIRISTEGLSTMDLKSRATLTKNPVHRITAWYPDESSADTFGVVTKGEGGLSGEVGEYSCIVLKSPKAKATVNALKQLLDIVFEPEFEEVQEQPEPAPSGQDEMVAASLDDAGNWQCKECTWANFASDNLCKMCQAPNCAAEDDGEMVDPYGMVSTGDADGDDGEDGFIPSFEATHDEEVTPDYMNIFDGAGLGGEADTEQVTSPMIAIEDEDDTPDYMNLPSGDSIVNGGEDGDEVFRERTSSAPPLKRNLSWSNPFRERPRTASTRSAKNPFNSWGNDSDDDDDDDDDLVGHIDFNELFSKAK